MVPAEFDAADDVRPERIIDGEGFSEKLFLRAQRFRSKRIAWVMGQAQAAGAKRAVRTSGVFGAVAELPFVMMVSRIAGDGVGVAGVSGFRRAVDCGRSAI